MNRVNDTKNGYFVNEENEDVKIIFLRINVWKTKNHEYKEVTSEIYPHQFSKPNLCPESTSTPTNLQSRLVIEFNNYELKPSRKKGRAISNPAPIYLTIFIEGFNQITQNSSSLSCYTS